MIDVVNKIHDKFSLEFKIGFRARRKVKFNNFILNTWVFVPNSLDINASTYKREDFYKDIRTNIRLITPVFLVRSIAGGEGIPLRNLETAMQQVATSPTRTNLAEYEYQLKMFSAIFKSAIRDQLSYIYMQPENMSSLIDEFLVDTSDILHKYRNLAHIIKTPTVPQENYNYYLFGDEFMSNLIEKELFVLLFKLKKFTDIDTQGILANKTIEFIEKEKKHKTDHSYPLVDAESNNKNSDLIFRLGALKKYIESDLFLDANKKRDAVLVEQVYLSLAAGLSMIFATTIAFSVQLKYGSFTMPLFVALVVSYMLKDRIKELTRYYFAQKKSDKYFDNKTIISVKHKEIGWEKEGFDFIPEKKVPKDVIRLRNRIPLVEADNRNAKEKIILFRKMVKINRESLDKCTNYNIEGVVEIIRFNVASFMKKMDNPEVHLSVLDDDNSVKTIMGIKNYYLNIIFQYTFEDDEQFKRYRVGFNRSGINTIKEMK